MTDPSVLEAAPSVTAAAPVLWPSLGPVLLWPCGCVVALSCALLSMPFGCTSGGTGVDPGAAAPPPNGPSAERDAWHAARLRTLAAEEGWLTLVGLDFLSDGTFRLGSGPVCEFRYAGASSPHVGDFVVERSAVRFRARSPGVTLDGTPLAPQDDADAGTPLVADDAGTPSTLRDGTLAITLVRRNGSLALRVRDRASPIRTGFTGIALFPYDGSLVVAAEVLPARKGESVAIANVTGFVEETPVAARLRFTLGGAMREFIATEGANGRLFVVFGDATNGAESYGGGRFLDIPAPVAGKTAIDFNRATNPPCAFTAFATCPTPPAGNRLPISIRAGERRPDKHAADRP